MYKVISQMKPCRDQYREQLIREGIPEEKLKALEDASRVLMEESYAKSKTLKFEKEDWGSDHWSAIQ
jgi:2-oxoglutarate dehydrogenase complex dehydrogenase (E1) component-like enzyme